mmetsp:Transcript_82/g.98  ORF Transcript_82/g.98 Transcript_82/m.98 type:complete len:92 (+) Transcript_82:88-363(+)
MSPFAHVFPQILVLFNVGMDLHLIFFHLVPSFPVDFHHLLSVYLESLHVLLLTLLPQDSCALVPDVELRLLLPHRLIHIFLHLIVFYPLLF